MMPKAKPLKTPKKLPACWDPEKRKKPLSRTERRAIRDKLTLAIYKFFDDFPFYYYILSSLPRIEKTNLRVPTMGVGFTRGAIPALYYDPHFAKALTTDQLKIILHHEAQHLGFRHIQRYHNIKDINPPGKGKLPEMERQRISNYAADIVVNHHIKNLDELPKWLSSGLITADKFDFLKGTSVRDQSYEELFKTLLQKMKMQKIKMGGSGGEGDGEGYGTLDDHDTWEDSAGDKDAKGDKEAKAKEKKGLSADKEAALDELVKDSVRKLGGRHAGNLPGEIERMIKKLQKIRLNWRQQISVFAQSCADEQRISTWKRLNRRLPFASPGRKREYHPKILVALDNSGSTYNIYDLFMAHILKISETVEIDCVGCDTRINFEFKINEGKLPPKFADPNSGGGTIFQPVFDYAKEKGKYDGIIYLTDGYVYDDFKTFGVPTLFAIGPGGQKLQGCRNIEISEDDNDDWRDV